MDFPEGKRQPRTPPNQFAVDNVRFSTRNAVCPLISRCTSHHQQRAPSQPHMLHSAVGVSHHHGDTRTWREVASLNNAM